MFQTLECTNPDLNWKQDFSANKNEVAALNHFHPEFSFYFVYFMYFCAMMPDRDLKKKDYLAAYKYMFMFI